MSKFFSLHWSLQASAFLVLWPSYTDTTVELTSDAIELHGCLLHDSQYLKHRILPIFLVAYTVFIFRVLIALG